MNIEEINQYKNDRVKLFVKEYPWFYMSASVHKILVHGADIVSRAILPDGQNVRGSPGIKKQESQVLQKKSFENNSRSSTNEGVLNLILVSSDPFI